jgi:hypothetical protein
MINLLSVKAKKKLWNAYRMRLGVVVLGAILFLEMLSALIFFPTFYVLRTTTSFLTTEIAELQLQAPTKSAEITKQLTALRAELLVLKSGLKDEEVLPSELLASIIDAKPKGISINAVAYQKEKDTLSVQFSGTANTRDDILLFKNTLSADVHHIVRTNDYLTKKTNIPFSITVTLK